MIPKPRMRELCRALLDPEPSLIGASMRYDVDDKVQVNLGGGLTNAAWTDGVVEEVRDDGRLRILVASGKGWRRVTRQPMFVRKPLVTGETP